MLNKILVSFLICLGLCLSFIEAKEQVSKHKYHPQTKEELKALIKDSSVNRGMSARLKIYKVCLRGQVLLIKI